MVTTDLSGRIADSVASPHHRRLVSFCAIVLTAAAAIIAIAGWRLFWFYTDDAFITFRYASNWISGFGPVWNPPPFQAVEGYSNFLWLAILTLAWKFLGIPPPQSANLISLLFGLATLILFARWIYKLLAAEAAIFRLVLFSLALGLLVTNRGYLTWLSSGLETSLFSFLFLWWCYELLNDDHPHWIRAALAVSLMALTRPDGLLFWAVTAALALAYERGNKRRLLAVIVMLAPVPAHLVWRHSFYHDWLPNTYYAKVIGAWPQMGIRYVASFILEYALYVPIVAAIAAFLPAKSANRAGGILPVVVITVCLHLFYYAIRVGGDHFEYRVLNHLIPIVIVGFVALVKTTGWSPRIVFAVGFGWLAMGLILPWTHWALTNDLATRTQTRNLWQPVAPALPLWLQPLARPFDALQRELIAHSVCIRHQEHKIFYLAQVATYPSRQQGSRYLWSERNVLAVPAVGVPGWVFPQVAVIDTAGLNDRILAHAALPEQGLRRMAHERLASRAYTGCYEPNLVIAPGEFSKFAMSEVQQLSQQQEMPGSFGIRMDFKKRADPLSLDARICRCESRTWNSSELFIAQ